MTKRTKKTGRSASDAALGALREFGLGYPGSHLKSPWPGHRDLAVKDKTFAYLSVEGEPFAISCKLPQSNGVALLLPFCEPTAYGLGKSGWVTAKVPTGDPIPLDLFKAWIDESYRAQAPKRLAASRDGTAGKKMAARVKGQKSGRSPKTSSRSSRRR